MDYIGQFEDIVNKAQKEYARAKTEDPETAAEIYWKYVSVILDKFEKDSNKPADVSGLLVLRLRSAYPQPRDAKSVRDVEDKFMAFVKAVEDQYQYNF